MELFNKSLSSYLDTPSLNGLIEKYGQNLERMERYEKFIVIATISTHFSCMYTGFVLDKGNLSEAYWQNNLLFHIADWTPTPVRQYFDELGKLDEENLLKLCEFLVTDLIAIGDIPMISSTINYVADHIDRIERRYAGQESLIIDSKWRIASHIDLLYDLNPDGTLTPDQIGHVDKYIVWFKGTEEGKEAIAQYQRRAA